MIICMKNKFNIIIFVLWFVIALSAVLHHEIWRDEAQAWCIVRDLSIGDIYQTAKVEGHPILWYLLLMPLAKFGLPPESMLYLSFTLTAAAVLFLLYKSPFNKFEKITIIFSAGMLYYLPAISRNYALIPLLIFLLAYYYSKKEEHPYIYSFLLILLSHTHVIMLGFCAILFLLFVYEKLKEKKYPLCSVIILFINFLFLFFYFYLTYSDNVVVSHYSRHSREILTLIDDFCYIYFSPVSVNCNALNMIIFYGALCVIARYLFLYNKKIFILFTGSFLYIFFIFAKVWFGGVSYQKAFLLLLIIVFCYSCCKLSRKLYNYAFLSLFIVSCILSVPSVFNEVVYNFSGSVQISNYIKSYIDTGNFGFMGYVYTISPISAYLPDRKFYYCDNTENKFKLVTFSDFRNLKKIDKEDVPPYIKYVITQKDVYLFEELGYKLIFATDDRILGPQREAEIYRIYEKI